MPGNENGSLGSIVRRTEEARDDRVIIALDLDAFYVAACRKRDPTLNNLPVAIKQKHIVATCSYEARALGVKKLALIKDAVRQCPELILVNGEDLSYFRKVSNEIFHLVSSMIKGAVVEKLGMDELFCDVTEMVDDMLLEQHRGTIDWFDEHPCGIVMPEETALALQSATLHSLEPMTQRILLGTQIAQRIRQRVAEDVGLTSSAGISTSKYLAKLVGNTNKPNKQTAFAPLHLRTAQSCVQAFLNPFPVRSLNGFGSVITTKMCETAIRTLGVPEQAASSERMTVLVAREIFDRQSFEQMFGARLAERLVGLLLGIDEEPVVRAPEFPAQISIEDTYQGLAFAQTPEQFQTLSKSLLRRLEFELLPPSLAGHVIQTPVPQFSMVERPYDEVGDPLEEGAKASMTVRDYDQIEEEDSSKLQIAPDTRVWKRFPLTMRLSVRQGYTNRVSRQTRMPVEIFDLRIDRTDRARVLAQSCESLFRTILAQEGNKGQGINLINIAALELSPHRPAKSIGGFFKSSPILSLPHHREGGQEQSVVPAPQANVDLQFLLELPKEMRNEIAAEYGITLDEGVGEEDEVHSIVSSQQLPVLLSPSSFTNANSQMSAHTFNSDGSSFSTTLRCDECGHRMSVWMQHDHERWPKTGLPIAQSEFDDHDQWDDDEE